MFKTVAVMPKRNAAENRKWRQYGSGIVGFVRRNANHEKSKSDHGRRNKIAEMKYMARKSVTN